MSDLARVARAIELLVKGLAIGLRSSQGNVISTSMTLQKNVARVEQSATRGQGLCETFVTARSRIGIRLSSPVDAGLHLHLQASAGCGNGT